jgi:hypothetical protein
MKKEFLIAILLSVIGVVGFMVGASVVGLFFGFFIAPFALIIPFICYFIIQRNFREYLWKSVIIGTIIGFPIGMFCGIYLMRWYESLPFIKELAKSLIEEFSPKGLIIARHGWSRCSEDKITLYLYNPLQKIIKIDEVRIKHIKGSCERYEFSESTILPESTPYVLLYNCTKGAHTIKVISPNYEDEITLEC